MKEATVLLAFFATLLPIWRQGAIRNLNFWEYLSYINQKGFEPFGHPHIPYSEAQRRAQLAWENKNSAGW